ncbi:MAG: hypothetical protein EOO44_18445 [Flavobacterium sp.]|nr:MAG: hypothetical protein EOO44_18445 [Flavobacterium sp.]
MRPADIQLINDITTKLNSFQQIISMPGILTQASLNCLVRQMVDSVRRIKYVTLVKNKNHNHIVCNPNSDAFDPIKAAAWYFQNNDINEAAWLVFLSTHFGKNRTTKWQLVRNVYGALGQQASWTWNSIHGNIQNFRNWLNQNESNVKLNANFGNHRKYESINALQNNGTGEAIATYINWINITGNHPLLFSTTINNCNNNVRLAFAELYNSMNCVTRFGRTARFDYLTMIGKLGLAQIEPDSTYMQGATGPRSGARLLFGSNQTNSTFDSWLRSLDTHLGLYYGMQVLEDSLCNWQKSPNIYVFFGG